jgi:PhnB protein
MENEHRAAPEGIHTVTSRIVTQDAKQLVEFVKKVFDATGEYRQGLPTEVRIGDSVVLISDAGIRRPMTAFLYIYVNDTDTTYQRALAAGARSIEEPSNQSYGDRRAMVEDNWGNTWQIATHMQPASQSMQMMQMMWPGAIAMQAIHVAAKFALADLVADGPKSINELADARHTHGPSMARLLRALTSLGILLRRQRGGIDKAG